MNTPHIEMATRHFDRLALKFPVMCASDEFHFLPRVAAASRYYDRLESFEFEEIAGFISDMKAFAKELNRRTGLAKDLETAVDLELLSAHVAGFLIEMDENRSWRHNPLLYLKIAFIGLDHALTKPAAQPAERVERMAARLDKIPRLLRQACVNIERVPEAYYAAARAMLTDCRVFLTESARKHPDSRHLNLSPVFENAFSALDAFERFLESLTPVANRRFAGSTFQNSLKDHFRSTRSLDEIFQIAGDEWRNCLDHLQALQSKLDPRTSWQELYHSFFPADMEAVSTLSLYRREARKLKEFFSGHGFGQLDPDAEMEVIETPSYLRSVRGSASFAAAFTADEGEKSFFYITSRLAGRNSREAGTLLKKRLQREYKFLTAHETFPGHHLLDSIRRGLTNPIRSQIESPLFYEGWATYAETLLAATGYVDSPIEHLVDYKRRLWRAARCRIDVGLYTGKLDRSGAVDLLEQAGFSKEEADRQIDRFQLNPGYQLCYTLGSFELNRLVETYGPRLGREQCHRLLLTGGELPFHLIEKRLAAMGKDSGKGFKYEA